MKPKNFIKKIPEKKGVKKSLFTEDMSPVSDSEEEETTGAYAANVSTKPRVFKFHNFLESPKSGTNQSPTSSSIGMPSPNARKEQISLEMESE